MLDQENIKLLLQSRQKLLDKLGGNGANMDLELEFVQPQLNKIDELIKIILK